MLYKSYITESYINLFFDDKRKDLYKNEVYDMLDKAYTYLEGGLQANNAFANPEIMKEKIPFWKIYKEQGIVKSVIMYKDRGGRKAVAFATDGSQEGKNGLIRMIKDNMDKSWMEVSGKAYTFLKKLIGEDELENMKIKVDTIKEILPNENIKELGDEHEADYERTLISDDGKILPIRKKAYGVHGNPIRR